MMKLIIGVKGTGKTKTLINMVNEAVDASHGDVVCIEKGTKLRFDIKYQARLINTEEYYIEDARSLAGFIAGILASNPDILILDEPTVGLDPKGKLEIIELLKKIQAKTHKTIILVTHDMSVVAEVSKRVLVMKQGNLVCDCTPRHLFTNIELLESYNLDLPIVAKLALDLKKEGLIDFDTLPIRRCELENAIMGLKTGDMNE